LPVTVAVHSGDRTYEEVVVLTDAVVDKRIPLSGTFRSVEVNGDNAALGHFERR
jgi:hypothetical protein